MRRKLWVLLVGTVLSIAPIAAAGHGGDPLTVRKCYESGPPPGVVASHPDPTGQTCDGTIDVGGVIAAQNPDDARPAVQVSVVDDVWGAGVVGGFVCSDLNGDNICGGQGEPSDDFCGTSEVIPAGAVVTVFLYGPIDQAQHCDPTAAPTGAATGGVASPAGGVFFTFR